MLTDDRIKELAVIGRRARKGITAYDDELAAARAIAEAATAEAQERLKYCQDMLGIVMHEYDIPCSDALKKALTGGIKL